MRCPHCRKKLVGVKPSYDRERDQRMLDLGCCTSCGKDKTDEEVKKGRWRCASCAEKHANRERRKRGVVSDFSGTHAMKPTANRAFLQRRA